MRASSPIDIHGVAAVRSSPGLLEPGVVGLRRPTLLLPEGILKHLPPPQLEAVIAHELSHVRRHDNLTAAMHMVVEAVFWFHPLVWWIGARLVEERERACDEAVLSLGGEPRDYADAIVSVCKLYVESPLNCVSGISGADLKKRIVRIMACHVGLSMSLGRKLLLGAAGLLAVAVPVVMGWGQVQAAKLMLIHPQDGGKHAFEVATIKPSPETSPGVRIMLSPANFSATDMSVSDMIKFAYGIKSDEQLVDGPGWLKTEHFDIQGKGSEADIATFRKLGFEKGMDVPRLMMQSLLEDRFQLKAKVETRDLPAYALVVDKRGIKMKEVTVDPLPPPGVRPPPGAHLPMFARTGPNEVTATAWGMPQYWNPANTAAQHYLRSGSARYRAQSFAISIGAYVHINAPDLALATTRVMLRTEPYDAEVAYTVHYLKDHLETTGSPDALQLAIEEHQKIIDALSSGTPLKASFGDTTVNIGVLFQMAMEAAFFARYAGNEAQAASLAADVEQALPKDAVLTAEDRHTIDSSIHQYRFLGSKLAPIAAIRSYKSATGMKPQINTNSGAATVLVIFPDWCVQCRKMMPTMTRFGVQHADPIVHAYGLMFKEPGEELASDTQKELLGTNVVEVSAETAHSFGTSDYPLGLIVDHAGVIRFIGELPSASFNGGYMEKLIAQTAGVHFKTPENPPKAK